MKQMKPAKVVEMPPAGSAYTAEQFARKLQISIWTFYRLNSQKHLPAPLPFPGAQRWAWEVVEEYVRSGRVLPQAKRRAS